MDEHPTWRPPGVRLRMAAPARAIDPAAKKVGSRAVTWTEAAPGDAGLPGEARVSAYYHLLHLAWRVHAHASRSGIADDDVAAAVSGRGDIDRRM